MTQDAQPPFEDAYRQLESIVQSLEHGGLTLERTIALFEEGMQLIKLCTAQLNEAELKVTKLQDALEDALQQEES